MKDIVIYIILWLFTISATSQSKIDAFLKPSDTLHKQRSALVITSQATVTGLSLLALNQLWYADFERSSFKTINDNSHWLQMDKIGHAFSSYHLGKLGANSLNWAGVEKKKQLIYGATLGLTYLTAIEVMDGFSEEWGFSWGDMAFNAMGSGLYVGQELLWKEQRILIKYSFHQTQYADLRPETLGNGLLEEMLKDYNGQTYWLSANVKSFFKTSNIPKWLNIAFGYGAEGMISATNDIDIEGFQAVNPYRQYYLSLDIDLSRIETNSSLLRTIFDVFNLIKVPFPTLEINSRGTLKLHYIYF